MRPKPDRTDPGQRSVRCFSQQAIAERCAANARVERGGHLIADTRAGTRTVETIHPPSYYIPPNALTAGVLRPVDAGSFCEWKGSATYWNVVIDVVVIPRVGWSYLVRTPDLRDAGRAWLILRRTVRPVLGRWRDSSPGARLGLRRLGYRRSCRSL